MHGNTTEGGSVTMELLVCLGFVIGGAVGYWACLHFGLDNWHKELADMSERHKRTRAELASCLTTLGETQQVIAQIQRATPTTDAGPAVPKRDNRRTP